MTHTVGDWILGDISTSGSRLIKAQDGLWLATVHKDENVTRECGAAERDANARLICMAPRLLAELKAMVENFKDTSRETNCYTEAHINAARAAIYAAGG